MTYFVTAYRTGQTKLQTFGLPNINQTKQEEKTKMPTATVNKVIEIPEGLYDGVIVGSSVRESGLYEYHETQVRIQYEDTEVLRNLSVPFKITNKSILGLILAKFGLDLDKSLDKEIDTEEFLKPGLKVEFYLGKKKTGERTFDRINPETFKPKE